MAENMEYDDLDMNPVHMVKEHYDGLYESGFEKGRKVERVKALKDLAKATAMTVGGSVLYKMGFVVNGDMGCATSLMGMTAMGAGATFAGDASLRYVKNSPKLKKALLHGYNNAQEMHSFAKKKVVPFVSKGMTILKEKTIGSSMEVQYPKENGQSGLQEPRKIYNGGVFSSMLNKISRGGNSNG